MTTHSSFVSLQPPVHYHTTDFDRVGEERFHLSARGSCPYPRDLSKVETHLLDTGHFALETHGEEIASRIEEFLKQN